MATKYPDIIDHNGITEWYDCRDCGAHIDPVGTVYAADEQSAVDEGRCPICGSNNVGMRVIKLQGETTWTIA